MSYTVSIQPRESGATGQRASVEAFIMSLPGIRRVSSGVFACGDTRRQPHVSIFTGDTDTIDSVAVSVPVAFTGAGGEQAFLLCFQIAEHLGWQVFDPQVGDYLDSSTATKGFPGRRDFGNTSGDVLRRRSAGEVSFGKLFCQQFVCRSEWVLIPTLIFAALVAGYLVVQRRVVAVPFPWIFLGSAIAFNTVRALVWTIWRRIRDDGK